MVFWERFNVKTIIPKSAKSLIIRNGCGDGFMFEREQIINDGKIVSRNEIFEFEKSENESKYRTK